MLLSHLNNIRLSGMYNNFRNLNGRYVSSTIRVPLRNKSQIHVADDGMIKDEASTCPKVSDDMVHTSRMIPMPVSVTKVKDLPVLSFDDVPGPKSLKFLSNFRHYFSGIGTQIMANVLTFSLGIGTYVSKKKPLKNLSTLFDDYGPVVRFVSPVGGDIVLLNHPEHIRKVFATEGDYPVRSMLDSLEKYRLENKTSGYKGLYSVQGEEWSRQRVSLDEPLSISITENIGGINEICESFVKRIYNMRNHQDEVPSDLHKEFHKWAFDCMGLIIFSKKFSILDTTVMYSQSDVTWLYHSLEKATEAMIKCETGMQLWKLFPTPAWKKLVKHCDNVDCLIAKQVIETEQKMTALKSKTALSTYPDHNKLRVGEHTSSIISTMILSQDNMTTEDVTTIIMDMLLIGVNTIMSSFLPIQISSSMSFLSYYLAKYQRVQRELYKELSKLYPNFTVGDVSRLREECPYLQACIKETLRLVPPIPVLTRILPKNITLDRYNIPRGTLIIMSTQDSATKEINYDDASKFWPERWLTMDKEHYHEFASVPFGYGARKCLGRNVSETMLSLMTFKMLEKYKLEHHYGDIEPTRTFFSKPNSPLKVRFIDRNPV